MGAITEQQIKVRKVTAWQPSWTEREPGEPGVYSFQLILDQGAEEYVIRPTAEDADVIFGMLVRGDNDVYFDMDRKVLMFGSHEA